MSAIHAKIAQRIHSGDGEPTDLLPQLANPETMSKALYLQLDQLEQMLGMDRAQGHDVVDGFDEIQIEVDRLLSAAPWTRNPDYGVILAAAEPQIDADVRAMESERFEVRLTANTGRITHSAFFADPRDAMVAFVRLGRSGFGPSQGDGSNVALLDKQGALSAGIVYEGRGVTQTKFAHSDGRDLFTAVEPEVERASRIPVTVTHAVSVDDLSFERLDWATAQALGFELAGANWQMAGKSYGVSGLIGGRAPFFSPTSAPHIAASLADSEHITVAPADSGQWRASTPDGACAAEGPDATTARLRALVKARVGEEIQVPVTLPCRVLGNEIPSDEVIARRVAAMVNHHHRGERITCAPDGDVFHVDGLVSAQPGSRDSTLTVVVQEGLSRDTAMELARRCPAVLSERAVRAADLTGTQLVGLPGRVESKPLRDARQALVSAHYYVANEKHVPPEDLRRWAVIEWMAASQLLTYDGADARDVVLALRELSPVCITEAESAVLTAHACDHLAVVQEVRAEVAAGRAANPGETCAP